MSALCVIDDAPATVGNLCSACVMTLHTKVLEVPRLLVELEVTVTKQSRQQAGGGYGGEGRPLVVNLAASDRADVVRTELQRMAASADGGYVPAGDARELAVWTCTRLSSVARRPDVAELWHGLVGAVREGWRAVDRAPERRVVGDCDCGAPLVTSRSSGEVRCRRCGVLWDIEYLDGLRQEKVMGAVVSTADLVAFFRSMGVRLTTATVRSWVARKQLRAVSSAPVMFRVADAVALWERLHGGPVKLFV